MASSDFLSSLKAKREIPIGGLQSVGISFLRFGFRSPRSSDPRHPSPLYPSQIGVGLRGFIPRSSQIGVDFSDQASIGVELKGFLLCSFVAFLVKGFASPIPAFQWLTAKFSKSLCTLAQSHFSAIHAGNHARTSSPAPVTALCDPLLNMVHCPIGQALYRPASKWFSIACSRSAFLYCPYQTLGALSFASREIAC